MQLDQAVFLSKLLAMIVAKSAAAVELVATPLSIKACLMLDMIVCKLLVLPMMLFTAVVKLLILAGI